MRILLLGGETRSALAVVRSLGKRGHRVSVASHLRDALAASSRYATDFLLSPDPSSIYYSRFITDQLTSYDLLLPVTDVTLESALQVEGEIRKSCRFPFISKETFELIADKERLRVIATDLGIKTPRSWILAPGNKPPEVTFPLAVKAVSSSATIAGGSLKTHYANTYAELEHIRNTCPGVTLLLQERLTGRGIGVFLLYRSGEIVTAFAHERLLEKPPSGGVSVLSRSIALSSAPIDESIQLAEKLGWEGVLMIEFKTDSNGIPHLLEINPRFWGSLQLAIDCGRDFPALLVEGDLAAPEEPYRVGDRLRWQLGTVDHLISRVKGNPQLALTDLFFRNGLKLGGTTHQETWRSDDPMPAWRELRSWVLGLIR